MASLEETDAVHLDHIVKTAGDACDGAFPPLLIQTARCPLLGPSVSFCARNSPGALPGHAPSPGSEPGWRRRPPRRDRVACDGAAARGSGPGPGDQDPGTRHPTPG